MDPALPPSLDIKTMFKGFSNEEIHQIGLAIIQQSQHTAQPQQQYHNPGSSHRSPPRSSHPTRPPLEKISIPISTIPPLMNHQPSRSNVRPLMEQETTPVISTPRRPASDSLENSNGNKRHKNEHQRNNGRNGQQQLPTLVPPPPHQHQPLSFNMNILKRAVSSNLPCFFIKFDGSIELNRIPSSIQVAIMLKKLFVNEHLSVNELSMCIEAGDRRFKFAVGNKEDFLSVFNLNWPSTMEDMMIEVIKPRSLPDCYSLVVRYIPSDIPKETARLEIIKTIPAAVAFSDIHYQNRQRPSYDVRFSVRDLEQYQTALQLGRLSIGQHYLPITVYRTGYRLTYCTACWKIGHTRDKCQSPTCCRKCLVPYVNGVKHFCQGDTYNCAQCAGNHFSLDSGCQVVKHYKQELKLAVDNALAAGSIKRPPPGEISHPFQQQPNNLPIFNHAQVKVNARSAWSTTTTADNEPQPQPLYLNMLKEVSDLVGAIKTLTETMVRTEKNFNELNNNLEFQHKQLVAQGNSINAVIDSVQLMSKWVQGNSNEKSKLKKNINKSIEDLQKWKQHLDMYKHNQLSITIQSPPPMITNNSPNNNININNKDFYSNEDILSNSHMHDD
jgi:hypothetical protein